MAATLYLVRHAKAGERRLWTGSDLDRPLSRKGHKQAEQIARSDLTPADRRTVQVEQVAVVLAPLAERLAKLAILGCGAIAPAVPCRDPPRDAGTPPAVVDLAVNGEEVLAAGGVEREEVGDGSHGCAGDCGLFPASFDNTIAVAATDQAKVSTRLSPTAKACSMVAADGS